MRYLLMSAGLSLMVWGFLFDAGVTTGDGGSILNLGLIATKQMIFGAGGVFFLAGVILTAAERIAPRSPAADPKVIVEKPGYIVGPGA